MSKLDETGSAHITPVDGNVFAELGFAPEEAAALKAVSRGRIAVALAEIHTPGEMLLEDLMKRVSLPANSPRLSRCRRATSARSCRARGRSHPLPRPALGRLFETAPRFWLKLQTKYDARVQAGRPDAARPAAGRRPGGEPERGSEKVALTASQPDQNPSGKTDWRGRAAAKRQSFSLADEWPPPVVNGSQKS